MTGMTGYGWYANEVVLQHRNTITEAFNRCSGENARIFWDTNPDYPEHPVKVDYINHSGDLLESGRVRIKSWHFELEDNTFLTAEYLENVKVTTPPGMWYDRRIKGLWVSAEGLVYEGWNPEAHVIEPFEIPAEWPRVFGIDWGFVNPFVILFGAIDTDGRLYIYDEYYKTNTLIRDHAKEFYRRINYKDAEGRIQKQEFSWGVADHDAQDNAEIRAFGINTRPAQKDVLIGLQKVAERLVIRQDGRPRVMIFKNCANVRREVGNYRWQELKDGKPAKEEPLKIDDHGPDVLRYIVMQLDHEKPHGIYI
jgi:PBSX family phage terminase large subunit